jgi:hypothetical protein
VLGCIVVILGEILILVVGLAFIIGEILMLVAGPGLAIPIGLVDIALITPFALDGQPQRTLNLVGIGLHTVLADARLRVGSLVLVRLCGVVGDGKVVGWVLVRLCGAVGDGKVVGWGVGF